MAAPPRTNAPSGVPSLDDLLAGGLVAGDNVVLLADDEGLAHAFARAFSTVDEARTTWVTLPPDAAGDGLDAVVDGIVASAAEHPHLVIDGLGLVHAHHGAEAAVELYRRCCPRLFDLGAIACWPVARDAIGPMVANRIGRIAQVVLELRSDSIRVAKAEGRPSRVQGRLAELDPSGPEGKPVVGRDLVAGRLGEGLKRLRRERSLTQRQLADLAGVTPAAISQAEAGRRGLSLETVVPLCDALGIGLDELLGTGSARRNVVARRDQRPVGDGSVALFDDPAGAAVYRVELEPGDTGRPPFTHKGPELLLVARGLVLVDLGDDTPVMRTGDALRVTTEPIGSWTNLGTDVAELFWLAEPANR